jgi:hypothetical protein
MSLININKIVVAGASITNSPWWTWKDFLQNDTKLPIIDLSVRGCGNEFIVHNLVKNQSKLDSNTLVIAMLTSIDKFDWYVQQEKFFSLSEQKHKPIEFSNNTGFWCTGSWFPDTKEIFKNNFYSEDYFVVKSIQQIFLLDQLSKKLGFKLITVFDSPIWTYTEQELDKMVTGINLDKKLNGMLDFELSKLWMPMLDSCQLDITDSSLIGYCIKNNLPWGNIVNGSHPPAGSHHKWYKNILLPKIKKYIDQTVNLDYSKKIHIMDEIWSKS